jgi:hypothetical protein
MRREESGEQMMKTRLYVWGVAAGLIIGGAAVLAHHSFNQEFDITQPMTLKGTLTKIEWNNPHGWIYLDVKGPDGKVVNWSIEAGSPNALFRRGLRKTDFPIGTEVLVDGYRAKDGTPTVNGITLKFADGRSFFMGTTGTGAPEPKEKE